MLVHMGAERLTNYFLIGQSLSGAVDGEESFAVPAFVLREAVIEQTCGTIKEIAKKVGRDSFA